MGRSATGDMRATGLGLALLATAIISACDASGEKPAASRASSSASMAAVASSLAVASATATGVASEATLAASSAPPAESKVVPDVVAPSASAFAYDPPRFLDTNPKCAVPPGMPTWSWDTLTRVDGLDVDAVVLTIDAGAKVANLEKELDILRDRKVRATVFLYTRELTASKTGPDVVKRILADGHELGNHTKSHKDLTKLSDDEVGDEVDGVETFVHDATGGTTKPYFRAPFLATNARVDKVLRERCYRPVWISIDSRDDRKDSKADDIVRAVLEENGKPRVFQRGTILLFHGSQAENLVALPKVIDGIRDQGFAILTLSDALRLAKPVAHRPLAK
jgi:peptidoglycan/xylan/chitin deacetylase (PgdA/CDA1 family)